MRTVGRYAIYDEIASGGMASVHFARLTGPAGVARTVAVKRAHPHLAREVDFANMLLDEARLASRIHHPNVVSTIDLLKTPDDLVLVMDYVHGESLWKLVREAKARNERVPAAIAAAIVVDTLHGLHAAHEAIDERGAPLGIVHRDVSPPNILVGVDGVARLADFGIAKAVGRLHTTRDSSVKGKFAYMAPEQVRGETVSRLTDTYATAIVMWELLTGEHLFAGKTEAETIHKSLVARVQPPSLFAPELGTKLDSVLKQALSRDPSRRYQTAQKMALDVEACIAVASPAEVGAWVQRIARDALAARTRVLADIERDGASAETRSWKGVVAVALLAALVAGVGVTALLATRATNAASVPAASSVPSVVPPPSALVAASSSDPSSAPVAPIASSPTSTSSASVPPSTKSAPTARPARTTRPARPKTAACDPPYSIDSLGRQIFKPECM